MASRASSDFDVTDPTVGGYRPEPQEPIPGWRTPIALAGWGVLIAVLVALIIWGIVQLAQGAPPQGPATSVTTTPTSPAPVVPSTPQRTRQQTTTPEIPTTSDAPITTSAPSRGTFTIPQLPSVITLPSLPGLPTEISLPPGL